MALRRAVRLSKSRAEDLSRHEWQGRREAAAGEWSVMVAQAQSFGSLPECSDEPGIGVVERLADSLGRSMDEWRRGAGERGGTVERIFRQDRLHAEHGQALE